MTALDLLLVTSFLGGMNVPTKEQAQGGYIVHAVWDATTETANIEYRPLYQEITGSGAWNGKARSIFVKGAGVRAITLPSPNKGDVVVIVDQDATAAAGNITIGGVGLIDGGPVVQITANRGHVVLLHTGSGNWLTL